VATNLIFFLESTEEISTALYTKQQFRYNRLHLGVD